MSRHRLPAISAADPVDQSQADKSRDLERDRPHGPAPRLKNVNRQATDLEPDYKADNALALENKALL